MRLLVTGADGFVGQHVLTALLARRHEVVGCIGGHVPTLTTLAKEDGDRVDWRTLELTDPTSTREAILGAGAEGRLDGLLHLAAASSVSRSWGDPGTMFAVNVTGALHLLAALRELPDGARPEAVVLVGSGEAYGRSGTEEKPLTEDTPLRPINPYGASKAAQEMIGWAPGRLEGVRIAMTRSFTQTGPGQSATFVAADWASQLLAIRAGARPPVLEVGDVEVVRDFLDVRDAADAYVALLEAPEAAGAFNVCSGRGVTLEALLEGLRRAVGVDVEVRVDPARLRPADIRSLVGDPGRIRVATGWRPRRELQQTLRDLVAFLEQRGAARGAP
ncbi:MAG: GDP-mannose 4,6-dehydratase [Gemmatimonadota bacterium]